MRPVLPKQEELQLAQRFQESGEPERSALFVQLVQSNRGKLWQCANELRWQLGVSHTADELLEQYGYEGYFEGLRRFDPSKGYRTLTYAKDWVRHEIRQGLAHDGYIEGKSVRRRRQQVFTAWKELSMNGGASVDDVVTHLKKRGAGTSRWRATWYLKPREVRMNEMPFGADATWPTIEHEVIQQDLFAKVMRELPDALVHEQPWAREALHRRWGILGYEEHTHKEAGAAVYVSRESVRLAERRVLQKLRERLDPGSYAYQ